MKDCYLFKKTFSKIKKEGLKNKKIIRFKLLYILMTSLHYPVY
ncbi:hypothetical protein AAJ76_3550001094 [Vairimorpha ceranae]|uniref:Uncharacterized protein n=1 Tax=Vairimorpha ceranae TaxID=40302 RepID=A0A0F9WKG7_9MICR|nr:hypothetical protein AAJ76_3550001094 [Vairimorpha ceranae]KKO73638.1 hypothetical protein AAJ76_3550001094 [Vairimorpha ceranae]